METNNASVSIVALLHVAVNNINIENITLETQQWFLCILLQNWFYGHLESCRQQQ